MANPFVSFRRIGGNELERDEGANIPGVAASAAASLLTGCTKGGVTADPVGRGGRLLRTTSGSGLRATSAASTGELEFLACEKPATEITGIRFAPTDKLSGGPEELKEETDADALTGRGPADDGLAEYDRPDRREVRACTCNGRNGEGATGSSGGLHATARHVGQDCRNRSHPRAQSSVS